MASQSDKSQIIPGVTRVRYLDGHGLTCIGLVTGVSGNYVQIEHPDTGTIWEIQISEVDVLSNDEAKEDSAESSIRIESEAPPSFSQDIPELAALRNARRQRAERTLQDLAAASTDGEVSDESAHLTGQAIERLRKELLDLTNRNPLLNYRHTERSRTHIRVVDELPDFLFEALRNDQVLKFHSLPEPDDEPADEASREFRVALAEARRLDAEYLTAMKQLDDDLESTEGQRIERELKDRVRESLGLPEWKHPEIHSIADYARSLGIAPSYELPKPPDDGEELRACHHDDAIQVLHLPSSMERKLSGIMDRARTELNERGVNTLYVAFGFLEWFESGDSSDKKLAPLIVLPVEIKRTLSKNQYVYTIRFTGEEIETNLALQLRLERDFGLALPELEESDTPESYFVKVVAAVEHLKKWRVHRFVTLGHFSFSRLVMYRDLDPTRWATSESEPTHSPVLAQMFGTTKAAESIHAEVYDVDEDVISKEVPLLITEADSSQFSAVVDVMRRGSVAIKGPPGTGKSQTITNIIAAALAKDMSVLFVAEKMAALEVVKKRLDDAGLGDFCFELHSTKSKKQGVLDALRTRLGIPRSNDRPDELKAVIEGYRLLKSELTTYVDLMNLPFGSSGMTVHQILWKKQIADHESEKIPASIRPLHFVDALSISLEQQRQDQDLLKEYEEACKPIIGSGSFPKGHPWRFVISGTLNSFEQEDLCDGMRAWREKLEALRLASTEAWNRLHPSVERPDTISELVELAGALAQLPVPDRDIDGSVIKGIVNQDGAESIRQLLAHLQDLGNMQERLRSMLGEIQDQTDLARSFVKIRDIAKNLPSQEVRLSEAEGAAKQLQNLATRVQKFAETWGRIGAEFGIGPKAELKTIRKVVRVAEFLSDKNVQVLGARSEPLVSIDNHAAVEELLQAIEALRATQERCNSQYQLDIEPNLNVLEESETALANAGFFSVFRPSYWRAKRFFRQLSKKDDRPSAPEMGQRLRTLRAHYLARERLELDYPITRLLGTIYRGLETDCDLVRSVVRYSQEVHSRFAGLEPAEVASRVALLQAPGAELIQLSKAARSNEFREVASFLNEYAEASNFSVSDLEADLRRAAHLLQELFELRARHRLPGHLSIAELTTCAGELQRIHGLKHVIENASKAATILGKAFRGAQTDPALLIEHLNYLESLQVAAVPDWVVALLIGENLQARCEQLHDVAKKLAAAAEQEARCREALEKQGKLSLEEIGHTDVGKVALDDLIAEIAKAISESASLSGWVNYRRVSEIVQKSRVAAIAECFANEGSSMANLPAAYDFVLYRSLSEQIVKRYPMLASFSGSQHSRKIERFRELDKQLLKLQRDSLRSQLSRKYVNPGSRGVRVSAYSGRSLIEHEIGKKKRHLPIRELLGRAGDSVQALKPCFMMSPLSVAQYLKPEGPKFDLVIVDEASQMKPAEAIGAFARGRQVVVVGDPKQLPPTDFFNRLNESDDDDPEDVQDFESILDLALPAFAPSRDLRWHYRSRHQSLIAFSNHQFYDNSLFVFPSPRDQSPYFGVRLAKVDGIYESGVNRIEVQEIVAQARRFMRDNPDRSLGIVTLNQKQRDLLQEEFEYAARDDRVVQDYLGRWDQHLESFFIKNLENVQGDERDVIFISVTYGPSGPGLKPMQRFGPINREGGHRRLNVLFTRAKESVVVFSSMTSEDILIRPASSKGVHALKHYLEYAATGRIETGEVTGTGAESPFEEEVIARLRPYVQGIETQVGVAGYRIDLAIRHEAFPHGFLLGIECDGATYHSAKSARDRDRLRQEVLEHLGWNIYRIWSTDWFNHPDRELDKLLKHIEELVERESRRESSSNFQMQGEDVDRSQELSVSAATPADAVEETEQSDSEITDYEIQRTLREFVQEEFGVGDRIDAGYLYDQVIHILAGKRTDRELRTRVAGAAKAEIQAGRLQRMGNGFRRVPRS